MKYYIFKFIILAVAWLLLPVFLFCIIVDTSLALVSGSNLNNTSYAIKCWLNHMTFGVLYGDCIYRS